MRYPVLFTLLFAVMVFIGCQQQAASPMPPASAALPAQPVAQVVNPSANAPAGDGKDVMPAPDSAKTALKVFINCLTKTDGKTLYNMFPPDVRTKTDGFYTENKKSFSVNIKSSDELLTDLLIKAKAGMSEDGYGFPVLLMDILDEDLDQISSRGSMQGEKVTYTTSKGEELVFTSQANGWVLGNDFADNILEGLIMLADL